VAWLAWCSACSLPGPGRWSTPKWRGARLVDIDTGLPNGWGRGRARRRGPLPRLPPVARAVPALCRGTSGGGVQRQRHLPRGLVHPRQLGKHAGPWTVSMRFDIAAAAVLPSSHPTAFDRLSVDAAGFQRAVLERRGDCGRDLGDGRRVGGILDSGTAHPLRVDGREGASCRAYSWTRSTGSRGAPGRRRRRPCAPRAWPPGARAARGRHGGSGTAPTRVRPRPR
jgi:hypothetical protein